MKSAMTRVGRRLWMASTVWMLTGACLLPAADARAALQPVRILLLGDSTVQGSICRKAEPKADHLEDIVRKRLAAVPGLPEVEVINQGRDGEYIQGLLMSRYDREIKPLGKFDYVLIRYGINDRAKREGFAENFTKDYRQLIQRLREDSPGVTVIVETTIPYANAKAEDEINGLVRQVAEAEKTPLIDIHEAFAQALKRSGPNALTYRRVKLETVPENLQPLLPAESLGIVRNEVIIMDNKVDAHFRDVPRWFGDRHPNLAGYHEIGRTLAEHLAPMLQKR